MAVRDLKKAIRERKIKEERRKVRLILKAAQKVFYANGYLKATMDDIALEAGMSKPLIYKHFKSKDDLYFSLMLPVFDETLARFKAIEERLEEGRYKSGAELIREYVRGVEECYIAHPDAFNILYLFQHTGMVWELNEEVRDTIFSRGRLNFQIGRRIASLAVEQGLFKPCNPYHFVDTIWGGLLGIIRVEDTKSRGRIDTPRLRATLEFFEKMIVESIAG